MPSLPPLVEKILTKTDQSSRIFYGIAELTRVLSQETEKFLKSKEYQRTEPARRKAGILAENFCRLVIHESANI